MGLWAYDVDPYLAGVYWILLKWVLLTQHGKLHQLHHKLGQTNTNAMNIIWVWMGTRHNIKIQYILSITWMTMI